MKAIFATFMLFAAIAAVHSKGLRGIISYTYDESFEGAKLYGQELSLKAFDKLLAAKDFGSEPKLLSSTYSILGLLDGKCDVKMECCKNCGKTCSVPETPEVPAFLSTSPVIDHPTKPSSRKGPTTRTVTSPRHSEPTPLVVEKIKSNATPSHFKPTPLVVEIVPSKVEVTPPPVKKVTPPRNAAKKTTTDVRTPEIKLTSKRTTAPKATATPQIQTATTPEATTKRQEAASKFQRPATITPSVEAIVTKKVETKEKTKTPEQNLLTPKLKEEMNGRPNRMINQHPATNKPFRGPPYIPQPEQVTERVDHTWKTYAHRDVTIPHHTWQPFVAAGTWNPNTVTYEPVTAAPKYVAPNSQLDRHF